MFIFHLSFAQMSVRYLARLPHHTSPIQAKLGRSGALGAKSPCRLRYSLTVLIIRLGPYPRRRANFALKCETRIFNIRTYL
jgi:hypothetical protein